MGAPVDSEHGKSEELVTGRLREAIATYEEVLRLRPGEPTALRNLALAREYLGE